MQIEIINCIKGYDDLIKRYISEAHKENDYLTFIKQIGDVIQLDKFHSLD